MKTLKTLKKKAAAIYKIKKHLEILKIMKNASISLLKKLNRSTTLISKLTSQRKKRKTKI
jgi:hypothetical protein